MKPQELTAKRRWPLLLGLLLLVLAFLAGFWTWRLVHPAAEPMVERAATSGPKYTGTGADDSRIYTESIIWNGHRYTGLYYPGDTLVIPENARLLGQAGEQTDTPREELASSLFVPGTDIYYFPVGYNSDWPTQYRGTFCFAGATAEGAVVEPGRAAYVIVCQMRNEKPIYEINDPFW